MTSVVSVLFFSCSPKKYLTADQCLLNKYSVSCTDDKSFDTYQVDEYIKQKPLRTFFGIALYARIYNCVNPDTVVSLKAKVQKKIQVKNDFLKVKYDKKLANLRILEAHYDTLCRKEILEGDSAKALKYYARQVEYAQKRNDLLRKGYNPKQDQFCFGIFVHNIGEEPTVYDEKLTQKSAVQIRKYLNTKGYYKADVKYQTKIKNRYAKVFYILSLGVPIKIDSVTYSVKEDTLCKIVSADSSNCILKPGNLFDIDALQNERTRLASHLTNLGYYGFTKDYIVFNVDTVGRNGKAHIEIEILPVSVDNNRVVNHRRFYISNVSIYPGFDSREALRDPETYFQGMKSEPFNDTEDSLYRNRIFFVNKDSVKSLVRPEIINDEIYINPFSTYSQLSVNDTYKHLSAFNVYKQINIEFEPSQWRDSINCNIYLNPNMIQEGVFEVEGTNSSGNIGAGASVTYRHKNFFHGAETFDLTLGLNLESQNDLSENQMKLHLNTQEYSLETKLFIPRLLSPDFFKKYARKYTPKTYFSLGFNYRQRPDYTRSVINATFNYQYAGADCWSHTLTPLRLSSIRVSNTDSAFLSWLEKLYIKDSYEDHFILGSSYTINYNSQPRGKRNSILVKWNISLAGNLLQAINKWNGSKQTDGSYTIPVLNVKYAQFFKTDIDWRYYLKMSKTSKAVYRLFAGIGIPYGNISQLPFSEQYFSGGANSIRAWQIRSVGPGSYHSDEYREYPNQQSDIKLEANMEYRFKMFWVLEGAWFVDAGNIWSLSDQDKRSGGQFSFSSFYKELAVGSGLGMRFDFDFFIFRMDFGLKLHDPALPTGSRWTFDNDKKFIFNKDNWAFCLGIGYPF